MNPGPWLKSTETVPAAPSEPPASWRRYSTVTPSGIWPIMSSSAIRKTANPPSASWTFHAAPELATSVPEIGSNRNHGPLSSGTSPSSTKAAPVMSASVTASKAASASAGVKSTISASLAAALFARFAPATLPGPATPPFSFTPKRRNAMSHSVEDAGSVTETREPPSAKVK